jgi:hypothetical protein
MEADMFARNTQPSSTRLAQGLLCSALFTLTACTPPRQPLQITYVSVSPEPVVGEIVTLMVEVTADNDEPDVTFTVDTLESAGNMIHLVSGEPQRQASLAAGEPQAFSVQVCVVQEGSWPIEVRAVAHHPDGSLWDALETIHLESTLESGRLIRSKDYTFSQEDYATRATPRPFELSPECSGQQGSASNGGGPR